jgi:hypothetical protein
MGMATGLLLHLHHCKPLQNATGIHRLLGLATLA